LPPYDKESVNAVDGGREPSHPLPSYDEGVLTQRSYLLPSPPTKRGEGGPLAVDEGFKVK